MFKNKTVQNAKWIVGCKIIQILMQFVVGMLSARYLGPSNYGLISYAASLVAFTVPLMQLGLRSTLVQEFVENPEKEGQILGTSLLLNLVSGAACILGVVCFVSVVDAGERTTWIVCVIYSLQLLFQTMEMLQCWFQAKLLSKYASLATLGAYALVSTYKIFLLATQKSVYWFALAHSVEYFVVGSAMMVIYKKLGGQSLSCSWSLTKQLLSRSKYYILANLMVVVFQNTDHVMLKLMVGEAENGIYTAAVTCVGVAGFVYTAILDSARPTILESMHRSRDDFEKNISRTYTIIFYLGLLQSVCFVILGGWAIRILYGAAYLRSVPVLRILTWNVAFSYMGSVRNIWILGEEKHNVLWIINLGGAVANVVLNACLIPSWGACGAAVASVLTQIFTNFVLGFFLGPIRPNNKLILKGLAPKNLVEIVRDIKHEG